MKKGSVDDEINNIGMWKEYENKLRGINLNLAYPNEVDNLMFNLLEDFNELKNVTIKNIADFHYRFELIHPFQDGNGRIGRFIILKQCIDKNIDLIAIDNKYDDEYRKALYIAQTTNNSDELVKVFKKCQEALDEKFKDSKNILDKIDEEIK